jgi:fructokinase
VGVGTPGAISPATGLIKNANSTALIGYALDKDLSSALGCEVRFANDANCFALSEAVDGAGAGAEIVFGVIIGTGTGGGIAIRGKILTGVNAIAGEWGHNPIPWPRQEELPGPQCYCGRKGCLETFLSGPGLSRDFLDATGTHFEPPEIVRLAEANDQAAEACLSRYEERLARGLAHVINIGSRHNSSWRRYVEYPAAVRTRPSAVGPITSFPTAWIPNSFGPLTATRVEREAQPGFGQ